MSQISRLKSHISLSCKQKRLPRFGGRRSFGFYFFTPYDYLPPDIPVVEIVVVMVQLLFIFNGGK